MEIMMNIYEDEDAWVAADFEDLWLYDKLLLSKKMGYVCGPVGVDVPEYGTYIVRPITNILGMGKGAEIHSIFNSTDHLPAGYFWCELFTGPHISIDYVDGKQVLAVEGDRSYNHSLSRWDKWSKTDTQIPYPFDKVYPRVNCEFIGDKLVEVHLRLNPDFRHGDYKVIRPVWRDDWNHYKLSEESDGTKFIVDVEGDRLGFLVRECDQ